VTKRDFLCGEQKPAAEHFKANASSVNDQLGSQLSQELEWMSIAGKLYALSAVVLDFG